MMQQQSPVGMPLLPPGGGLQASEPWYASRYKARQFFIYEADFTAGFAGVGPNEDAIIQIKNDSDFFWTELNAFALDGNGDATTVANDLLPALVIQITDIATGRQYDSTLPELAGVTLLGTGTVAVPFADVTGTAQLPFLVVAQPVLWERNSVIRVSVNGEAGAGGSSGVYSVVHLSFIGVKAFY
jgi:hypothetical protein